MKTRRIESNGKSYIVLHPEYPGDKDSFVRQLRQAVPVSSKSKNNVIIAGKSSTWANIVAAAWSKHAAAWCAFWDWTDKTLVVTHDTADNDAIGKTLPCDWMPVPIPRKTRQTCGREDVKSQSRERTSTSIRRMEERVD